MAEIVWLPPIRPQRLRPVSLIDAMQALVYWNRVEKPLYERMRRQTDVSYQWFLDVLSEYKLSSTFPVANRQKDTDHKKITSLLSLFKQKKNTLDYVTVLAYELEPFTTFGKANKTRNPIAAASLMMWFFNREEIVLYDPQAKKTLAYLIEEEDINFGPLVPLTSDFEYEDEDVELDEDDDDMEFGLELEIEMPFDLDSYYDYHQCWIDMYLNHAADIYMICTDLLELCDYEGLPEPYEYNCLKYEWFHRRVFATWLHNIADELPKKR